MYLLSLSSCTFWNNCFSFFPCFLGLLKQKTKNTQLWMCGFLIFSPNIIIGYGIKEKKILFLLVPFDGLCHLFSSFQVWIIHPSCCFSDNISQPLLCTCGWKVWLVCSLVVFGQNCSPVRVARVWEGPRGEGAEWLQGRAGTLPPTVNVSWWWPSRWLHQVLLFEYYSPPYV